ncbi:MAG: hypothetical protein JWL76_1250 [Thermoleophilia bacterium]|nr:hypothetical protein [Thermoleophilia bacterium]
MILHRDLTGQSITPCRGPTMPAAWPPVPVAHGRLPGMATVYEVDELEQALQDLELDDPVPEHERWYAINTAPWPCPACGEEFEWVTACHHVVIAETPDPLLEHASIAKKVGRDPRIIKYDGPLPTITLDQWRALGRPVHGVRRDLRPD